jgi:hypothetical protein
MSSYRAPLAWSDWYDACPLSGQCEREALGSSSASMSSRGM